MAASFIPLSGLVQPAAGQADDTGRVLIFGYLSLGTYAADGIAVGIATTGIAALGLASIIDIGCLGALAADSDTIAAAIGRFDTTNAKMQAFDLADGTEIGVVDLDPDPFLVVLIATV